MSPPRPAPIVEPLGCRIAGHRVRMGLTQQRLAERIALSRAALSHLEGGLSIAGERTVTLLAGVFGLEPHELVAGTDYPLAKAERLPLVAARHSELDLILALLDNDLGWCDRLGDDSQRAATIAEWRARLGALAANVIDPDERRRINDARSRLTATN
jgi:transcriptional regulator with XRE-family HTH domain